MQRIHTQIVIADPHVLFRRGLKTVLSSQPDFDVTEDTSALDGLLPKLLGRAEETPSYPDVLLVCEDLLSQSSGQQLEALNELGSRAVVLALTITPASNRNNALPKSATPAEIVVAVRHAVEMRRAGFSYSLQALKQQMQQPAADRTPALTSRETEIVRLLADGMTARDTATELHLSVKTVEAHKLNIMRKLGVHKRSELLRYAEQNGIVQRVSAA